VDASAEYAALVRQVFRAATEHVERAAAVAAGSWGVVADADETLISNVTYQAERARLGLGFDRESWHAWVLRRQAEPLPGAAAFLARVRALGGRIAVVTNRTESECPATADVFRAHGLPYDVMLCRPEAGPSDKGPRFQSVAQGTAAPGLQPLEIVAFLGDNIRDFPGLSQSLREAPEVAFSPFGERYFVLPNPMYGSWE
jgi:5'-nucleotidase (lipoprotein e(P4) family)